jgi:hypothetical protein
MLSTTKELKNIPISISLLHEQEYNNLCLMLKMTEKPNKRRAFSERNKDKSGKVKQTCSPKLSYTKETSTDQNSSLSSFMLI